MDNNTLIGELITFLAHTMHDYVLHTMQHAFGDVWEMKLAEAMTTRGGAHDHTLDIQSLFNAILRYWDVVFSAVLPRQSRNFVYELKDVRNAWAHQRLFSDEDTYRALDTAERLFRDMGAVEAAEQVRGSKMEVVVRMAASLGPRPAHSSRTPHSSPTPEEDEDEEMDDGSGWGTQVIDLTGGAS